MRGFLPPFPTIHIIIPAVLTLSASYFSGVSLVLGDRVSYFALLVSMRSLSMVPGIIIRIYQVLLIFLAGCANAHSGDYARHELREPGQDLRRACPRSSPSRNTLYWLTRLTIDVSVPLAMLPATGRVSSRAQPLCPLHAAASLTCMICWPALLCRDILYVQGAGSTLWEPPARTLIVESFVTFL